MTYLRYFATALAAALVVLAGAPGRALAVTNSNGEPVTPYVAAFAPVFGLQGVPHTGTMQLVVENGTITGTYTGTSVAPDNLNDRIVPVIGTLSPNDGYVQLNIGGTFSLRGTMDGTGAITGTASYDGGLYEFAAQPGRLRV
ncbi:MAG: hypothetical protein JOZ77_02190 [Candidatus Eremiobacteraeota bacterium]|nr:hypothetical protein [Candidatus Eremiobacteraeota bacterium]